MGLKKSQGRNVEKLCIALTGSWIALILFQKEKTKDFVADTIRWYHFTPLLKIIETSSRITKVAAA